MAQPEPAKPTKATGKNWWTKLDPKRRRLILAAGAVILLALVYLATRSGSAAPTGPLAEEGEDPSEGGRENVYPSAEQYGFPTGPSGSASEGGAMIEGPEGVPGVEGLEGSEGPTGAEGPTGEPGPPGAPGPHKKAAKAKAGGKTHGGGHAGTTKRHQGKKNRSGGTSAKAAHRGVNRQRKRKQRAQHQRKQRQPRHAKPRRRR